MIVPPLGNTASGGVFMVKGVSRQVIVVRSPDPDLFEQAIFILKDDAIGKEGVTDEALLKEANKLVRGPYRSRNTFAGPVWAFGGAIMTGALWLLSLLL